MSNTEIWDMKKDVPGFAQKKIPGGRLKGMTDIKPQWRLLALTEMFGACGFGWKYRIIEHWTEQGAAETSAHVRIALQVKKDDVWSGDIEGIGGSLLIANESKGLHHSDEAYKMATTDAISVACKQLGIGATVYMGGDYSKYSKPGTPQIDKNEIIKAEEYRLAMNAAKTAEDLKAIFAEAFKAIKTPEGKKIVSDAKDEAKKRLGL